MKNEGCCTFLKLFLVTLIMKLWKSVEKCRTFGTRQSLKWISLVKCRDNPKTAKFDQNDGIDLVATDNFGNTVFHYACKNGCSETVKVLLDFSKENEAIDLNARDNLGRTAYHLACTFGRTEIVKLILDFSKENDAIDLNARDKRGMTAFHMTCKNGYTEIVKLILDFSQENDAIGNVQL